MIPVRRVLQWSASKPAENEAIFNTTPEQAEHTALSPQIVFAKVGEVEHRNEHRGHPYAMQDNCVVRKGKRARPNLMPLHPLTMQGCALVILDALQHGLGVEMGTGVRQTSAWGRKQACSTR